MRVFANRHFLRMFHGTAVLSPTSPLARVLTLNGANTLNDLYRLALALSNRLGADAEGRSLTGAINHAHMRTSNATHVA